MLDQAKAHGISEPVSERLGSRSRSIPQFLSCQRQIFIPNLYDLRGVKPGDDGVCQCFGRLVSERANFPDGHSEPFDCILLAGFYWPAGWRGCFFNTDFVRRFRGLHGFLPSARSARVRIRRRKKEAAPGRCRHALCNPWHRLKLCVKKSGLSPFRKGKRSQTDTHNRISGSSIRPSTPFSRSFPRIAIRHRQSSPGATAIR